ncbi:hypothetical protein [Streptomyces ipomoeae]|nr:hypothetical protein [Streptomyces ipomoeae]
MRANSARRGRALHTSVRMAIRGTRSTGLETLGRRFIGIATRRDLL